MRMEGLFAGGALLCGGFSCLLLLCAVAAMWAAWRPEKRK
ncbi:hypothetical protein GA0070624_2762 [Micromonospora rhizosphaerae]|uniref:Uncharacterized protein n=1 Tax=Micromonospora rhizosphaerae TaxID=568872 RepID=A0A1C6S277_9ACTN|nr:hypothetical protein GA0070624_2762 [Micromonospora rhizosphaerae]